MLYKNDTVKHAHLAVVSHTSGNETTVQLMEIIIAAPHRDLGQSAEYQLIYKK